MPGMLYAVLAVLYQSWQWRQQGLFDFMKWVSRHHASDERETRVVFTNSGDCVSDTGVSSNCPLNTDYTRQLNFRV